MTHTNAVTRATCCIVRHCLNEYRVLHSIGAVIGCRGFRASMQELIQDPVVAMDGFSYERSAILDWFMERPAGFSYLTKQRLPSKVLLPNKDYRSLVVQLIS